MDSTAAFNSLGPLQLELILSTATAGMQTFGARCCVILLAAAMITAVAGGVICFRYTRIVTF